MIFHRRSIYMDDLCTTTEPIHPSIKVVVVGDDSVGKSCLVTRFVNEEFDPFQPITVGSYCLTKIVEHSGNISKLQVDIMSVVMIIVTSCVHEVLESVYN